MIPALRVEVFQELAKVCVTNRILGGDFNIDVDVGGGSEWDFVGPDSE